MTRKDYQIIAAALKEARRSVSGIYPAVEAQGTRRAQHNAAANALAVAEDHICALLRLDNPLFDRQRFDVASGRRLEDISRLGVAQ